MTIDETLLTEDERFSDLKDAKKRFNESEGELMFRFLNKTGQHEAQDRAFIAQEHVESYLCDHPFVIFDKESWRLAKIASQCLADLYQRIGNVKLDDRTAAR